MRLQCYDWLAHEECRPARSGPTRHSIATLQHSFDDGQQPRPLPSVGCTPLVSARALVIVMKLVRKKSSLGVATGPPAAGKCVPSYCRSTSALFRPGVKLLVQRAPLMSGLSVSNVAQKKFQRPMLKRRAYGKAADEALRSSSLGPRRRLDGMARLLARAGRGLTYKLPEKRVSTGDTSEESDSEDDETGPDKPFEPLQVWKSPHEGGEAKGLPPRRYVIIDDVFSLG
jgi:hypothetical protein